MKPAFPFRLAWLLILLLPLSACWNPAETPEGPVVLAAASLQEVLEDAAEAWQAEGHAAPVLSFAASSALARQVIHGAPADLYISADAEWMDEVERQGLLRPGTRGDLAGNALVVIRPKGAGPVTLARLGDAPLALADPAAVPAGRYARASLEHLGLWRGLQDNVVPAENVRSALALVERGEAALGVVYATDALASDKVEVVERLPAASHPPIRYPVAVLAASSHPDAEAFRTFLASEEGRRLFERRGFGPAE